MTKTSITVDSGLHLKLLKFGRPFYKSNLTNYIYQLALKLYLDDPSPVELQQEENGGRFVGLHGLREVNLEPTLASSEGLLNQVRDLAKLHKVSLQRIVREAVSRLVNDPQVSAKIHIFKGLHPSGIATISRRIKVVPLCLGMLMEDPEMLKRWRREGKPLKRLKRKSKKVRIGSKIQSQAKPVKPAKPSKPVRQQAPPSIISSVVDLSYRQEKFKIRRWLLEQIELRWPKRPSVSALTLPGSEWLFERDLLILKPESKIIGLEANRHLYYYAAANVPPSNQVSHINQTDKEYFEGPSNNLDVVWLDYMGQFMPQRLDVFENMLSKGHLSSKCLLAVTFLKGRESAAIELYKQYGEPGTRKGKYNELRKIAIPDLYKKVALKHGYDLDVLKIEEYQEKQGDVARSPMMFFVFMLKKNQVSVPTDLAARKATIYKTLQEGKKVTDTLGFTRYQIAGFRAALTRKAPVTQLAGFRVAITQKAPVTQ